jgi:hypothetical protein
VKRRTVLATIVALLLMPAAALAAGRPKVSVRVEGVKRTLLAPKTIRVHSGWITRDGAPSGACPAKSAQGALDVATHHRWHGVWSTEFNEYEITSILGETHRFTSNDFWEIFVNNVAASLGGCELKPHAGEQLLFAAVPAGGNAFPLALRVPTSATVGQAFTAKVVYFAASGKAKPLAGATVSFAGSNSKTNTDGTVTLTPTQAGTFVIHAKHAWSASSAYIRAAPVTVHVS